MRKYEKVYLAEKKARGKREGKAADFGRVEVCCAWFEYREIELIKNE